jgi:hypothetical protein
VRLIFLYRKRDYAGFVALENEFDNLMARHGETIGRQSRIVGTFYLAYARMMLGQYTAALERLVPLLNTSDQLRPEIQTWARLLQMMIHYEQGNIELIPYLWRSIYRALRKRNALYRFERILLGFLRGLVDIHNDGDLRRAFGTLRDELGVLANDPYESETVTLFNAVLWLEKKLAE